MKRIAVLAGTAALGLTAQTAFGYGGTADLTFTIGGSISSATADQGIVTSAGAQTIIGLSNSTLFAELPGANSAGHYNSDFATTAACAIGGGIVPSDALSSTARKYGCRWQTPGYSFQATNGTAPTIAFPVADGGPLAQASGTLTVTDTTLTGVLTIVNTSDEAVGGTTIITTTGGVTTRIGTGLAGFAGFNYRTADGSPFGNVWYGVTNSATITLNLTGTFTQASWTIDGGSADFVDPNFACAQGGFGGDNRGTLCSSSLTGGGFQTNGRHISWGLDPDGAGTGSITEATSVHDSNGDILTTLAGVLASVTIDVAGNITSGTGEFRRGSGSNPSCPSYITYNTGTQQLTCGSITAGRLVITGTAPDVPVPAAAWLIAPAVLAAGRFSRRRRKTA